MENYISYSELKDWYLCAFHHKLKHIDDVGTFNGNIFTVFGHALHHVCETKLFESVEEKQKTFSEKFRTEIDELKIEVEQKDFESFEQQGNNIIPYILPELQKKFGTFEIISAEEQLYEPIKEFLLAEYSFKGFIDLIIKTEDGKYHIIDWKTCSWGWDLEKKSDRMVFSQLLFYKYFFSQKTGIDLKNIETYFILLKRTAKKDNVEIFRVTSGPKRLSDAMSLLKNALSNIHNKKYFKNKLNCSKCEFYNTQHCTR
jgi:ATP-dependent exoDNAse (exonuclease V) beta subunit